MRKYKRMICESIMLAIEDERKRLEEASFLEIGMHTSAIRNLVVSYLMITRRGRKVERNIGFVEVDPDGCEENEEAEDACDS